MSCRPHLSCKEKSKADNACKSEHRFASNTSSAPDIARACPGCRAETWTDFFISRGVPVDVGSALATEADARRAPVADITLAYCHCCGLVWNRAFDSSRIAFKPGYQAGLHHSPLVRSVVAGTVDRLIQRFDLRGKNILEIGCGDGYFLRQFCERGGNSGIGIDPTAPESAAENGGASHLKFIRDFYSKRYNDLPCDFLCCQSVLEDIANPLACLADVHALASKQAAPAYFEVFNAARSFEQLETWSIHYEQCNYFGLESFTNLFRRCGFDILDAEMCAGNDQYIFAEVKAQAGALQTNLKPALESKDLPDAVSNFAACHSNNIEKWRTAMSDARRRQRNIVLWGSGGKGVSFLNAIGTDSGIRYVVDINPSRHGRFVPGSGQQIVPPAFLTECRPDVVILSNSAYESEIRSQIASLGLKPELWHA